MTKLLDIDLDSGRLDSLLLGRDAKPQRCCLELVCDAFAANFESMLAVQPTDASDIGMPTKTRTQSDTR